MLEKIGDKNRYNKKVIIFILIIAVFFTLISYAASDVTVKKIVENGVQYIYFELNHNITTATYKYFGYGYHVTIYDNYGKKIGYKFLTNAEFEPKMIGGVETVKIPIESLYNKTDVEGEYYYRKNCTIWLNGRLGIRVNGTLTHLYDSLEGNPESGIDNLETGYATYDGQTVPLNKEGFGIKNGIQHEYGVSWSLDTQINLTQHFGIHFTLDPICKYDGYKVQYKEVSTGKTVSSEKPLTNFNETRTIMEYPTTVNGYEYSGYYEMKKVDSTGKTTNPKPIGLGDSATINLSQTASIYTIVFYYNKVDLSQIGKPVNIDVEYRKDTSTGNQLILKKTFIGGEYSQFNLSSEKIDDYEPIGFFVMGQATEYFYTNIASFILCKEKYSTPVNGRLKIIFIYKEKEYISIPKCTPILDGDTVTVNIDMKKTDFEKAIDIRIEKAIFKISDFGAGKDKDGNVVEGNHEFRYFDLYIKGYESYYDNFGKEVKRNFNIPKTNFVQSTINPNQYSTTLEATFAAFCSCFDGKADKNGNYGMEVDKDNLLININLIENKPPEAYFDYYTEKKLENGSTSKLFKSYIGRETIIGNQASDPNGITDIRNIKYTLTDSNNKKYYINLLMLQDEMYFLESEDVSADNIQFNGSTLNGDIKLVFKTGEKWNILQQVWDKDGAYQGAETAEIQYKSWYQRDITPEILDLRPIAVISDSTGYRYPMGVSFNGKQNRVVKYFSSNSYVADFLSGTGVTINHNRDCWEIVPIDGQNIDNIYFENKTGLYFIETDENKISIKYSTLNNTKLQFKEAGKYKIRLQVSDNNGNVSEWTEKIITINEDVDPQVTANINASYVRNASGIAILTIKNITPKSVDGDSVIMNDGNKIKYKYDSNNNGSFEDESLQDLILINNGSSYETTFSTSNFGKYQFIINVSETFGQEYLKEYITEDDYKRAAAILQTHVDNIEPDVIIFKIMTTEN